jgi:hypothetical protein
MEQISRIKRELQDQLNFTSSWRLSFKYPPSTSRSKILRRIFLTELLPGLLTVNDLVKELLKETKIREGDYKNNSTEGIPDFQLVCAITSKFENNFTVFNSG